MLRIRAEMPTSSDDWEVDWIAQYRCVYGVEQWLVKWKFYGEDRNTWEPWDNLLTPASQAEAASVREAALPRTEAGLKKLTLPTIKKALENRGLDPVGLKQQLIDRLLAAFASEA